MIWWPQQLLMAEQTAAGTFFKIKRVLFAKSLFLYPQALFTAEQAAADALPFFLETQHALLENVSCL